MLLSPSLLTQQSHPPYLQDKKKTTHKFFLERIEARQLELRNETLPLEKHTKKIFHTMLLFVLLLLAFSCILSVSAKTESCSQRRSTTQRQFQFKLWFEFRSTTLQVGIQWLPDGLNHLLWSMNVTVPVAPNDIHWLFKIRVRFCGKHHYNSCMPRMTLGTTRENLKLTSWRSYQDPSTGNSTTQLVLLLFCVS